MHAGSDAGWTVVMPRGPMPDILPLTEEEETKLFGGVGGMEGLKVSNCDGEDGDAGKKLERQGTSHEKENEKWYKAAKKVSLASGLDLGSSSWDFRVQVVDTDSVLGGEEEWSAEYAFGFVELGTMVCS